MISGPGDGTAQLSFLTCVSYHPAGIGDCQRDRRGAEYCKDSAEQGPANPPIFSIGRRDETFCEPPPQEEQRDDREKSGYVEQAKDARRPKAIEDLQPARTGEEPQNSGSARRRP